MFHRIRVFAICSASRESWSKHVYFDHDRIGNFGLGQTKKGKHGGRERRVSKCPSDPWGYNETQFLFYVWADDEIHRHSVLVMMPASPRKRTKIQSDNRYKIMLSLSRMEYFVPKIAQILSSYNDLKGPSPLKGLGSVIKLQNESNSKFQLHSSVLKV